MMDAGNETRVARAFDELERDGRFEPLSLEAADTQSWQDHDLASLVENRLGVRLDLTKLDERSRLDWGRQVTHDRGSISSPHREYQRSFWLRHDGRRVGTIAVATTLTGASTLRVSSLYVTPSERRRGHARRALAKTYAATLVAGLSGISLSTEWSWQATLSCYLCLGFWVRGWKRSIDLIYTKDLSKWEIDANGGTARFVVGEHDRARVCIVARHIGDRLEWREETPAETTLPFEAAGTFALALALRGFPLITSDEAWRTQLKLGFSDCGGPEALAFKIRRFEAWDRKHGWMTRAPRIPGLDYPDWDPLCE